MSNFQTNPTEFSAECSREGGQCTVERENILFLDDGVESTVISHLQMKCGHVVITPDPSNPEQALLYHTSCQRMTDVVQQIFQAALRAPASLPQQSAEMTLGEIHRRSVGIPFDECKVKVDGFSF